MATNVSHRGVFVDDHLLEAEIQQAEQEFLENSMIEETDDCEDFADPDFEGCLEYAATFLQHNTIHSEIPPFLHFK